WIVDRNIDRDRLLAVDQCLFCTSFGHGGAEDDATGGRNELCKSVSGSVDRLCAFRGSILGDHFAGFKTEGVRRLINTLLWTGSQSIFIVPVSGKWIVDSLFVHFVEFLPFLITLLLAVYHQECEKTPIPLPNIFSLHFRNVGRFARHHAVHLDQT